MFVHCNPLADVLAHAVKAAAQETPEETWQHVLCVSSGSAKAEAEGPRRACPDRFCGYLRGEGVGQQPRDWSEGQEGQPAMLWHRAQCCAFCC